MSVKDNIGDMNIGVKVTRALSSSFEVGLTAQRMYTICSPMPIADGDLHD